MHNIKVQYDALYGDMCNNIMHNIMHNMMHNMMHYKIKCVQLIVKPYFAQYDDMT